MDNTITEVTTAVTDMVTTVITTTVTEVSKLEGIDVDLLNKFLYLGSSFIIACLFWWVWQQVTKLFKIFF